MALGWGSKGGVGTEEAAAECASTGVGSTAPKTGPPPTVPQAFGQLVDE